MDGTTEFRLRSSVSVNFSGLIDTGAVRGAFVITPGVNGTFSLYFGSTGFSFYPTVSYRASTMYTVMISSLMRAANGTSLFAPRSFSFTTESFKVTNTSPYDGATGVSRNSSVYVYCNAPIDPATAQNALDISPSVSGFTFGSSGSDYFYFSPSTSLVANTLYTVTVSSALSSVQGDSLSEPYSFSFTAGS
ncbi:MAG: Ig-like domain-containing protein [Ignavibacteria bacterium]|nr:Ig-like domain-containing protein [Ignavibacteria bacterium]